MDAGGGVTDGGGVVGGGGFGRNSSSSGRARASGCGIGSNATQPMPSNSTSGQANASLPVTVPPPAGVWNPTTTRVGRPSRRPSVANAVANCSDGPALSARPRFAVQEEAKVRVRVPAGRVGGVRVVLGHERLHGQRPQVRRALALSDLLGERRADPVVRTGRPSGSGPPRRRRAHRRPAAGSGPHWD